MSCRGMMMLWLRSAANEWVGREHVWAARLTTTPCSPSPSATPWCRVSTPSAPGSGLCPAPTLRASLLPCCLVVWPLADTEAAVLQLQVCLHPATESPKRIYTVRSPLSGCSHVVVASVKLTPPPSGTCRSGAESIWAEMPMDAKKALLWGGHCWREHLQLGAQAQDVAPDIPVFVWHVA